MPLCPPPVLSAHPQGATSAWSTSESPEILSMIPGIFSPVFSRFCMWTRLPSPVCPDELATSPKDAPYAVKVFFFQNTPISCLLAAPFRFPLGQVQPRENFCVAVAPFFLIFFFPYHSRSEPDLLCPPHPNPREPFLFQVRGGGFFWCEFGVLFSVVFLVFFPRFSPRLISILLPGGSARTIRFSLFGSFFFFCCFWSPAFTSFRDFEPLLILASVAF